MTDAPDLNPQKESGDEFLLGGPLLQTVEEASQPLRVAKQVPKGGVQAFRLAEEGEVLGILYAASEARDPAAGFSPRYAVLAQEGGAGDFLAAIRNGWVERVAQAQAFSSWDALAWLDYWWEQLDDPSKALHALDAPRPFPSLDAARAALLPGDIAPS